MNLQTETYAHIAAALVLAAIWPVLAQGLCGMGRGHLGESIGNVSRARRPNLGLLFARALLTRTSAQERSASPAG